MSRPKEAIYLKDSLYLNDSSWMVYAESGWIVLEDFDGRKIYLDPPTAQDLAEFILKKVGKK